MAASGAVACGHPVTAAAAMEILEDGGNAYDAAIAAQFAACVAEPVLASLGGGGFLLAAPTAAEPRVYDFFAHTPRSRRGREDALHPIEADFGTATQTFHIGAASVATPGTVAGMFAVHDDLGSLPMSRLLAPAIAAATSGVEINEFQAYIFRIVSAIYADTPYALARPGEPFRQPELADTLEQLGRDGAALVYRGEVGQALAALCSAQGGHLDREDLAGYRVIRRAPLALEHRGATLLTNPAPSVGGVLIGRALGWLVGFGAEPPSATDIARALQQAAAHKKSLGANPAEPGQVSRGTTHISVVDAAGNLAAMTLSNGEGSGCMVANTGIMLNNMLGEDDINPAGIGHWAPDQRLGSMMAPTVIVDDADRYALGSGGSNRIRSAILQVIVNLLDRGLTPEAAVRAPRLHFEDGDSPLISLEPGFPADTVADLGRLAAVAEWSEQNLFFGGVHIVRLAGGAGEGRRLTAVGDQRRGGVGRVA